jgi:hypothetical protein
LLELEPIMRPRFVTPCAIGAILFALTWTPSASQASTLRAPGGGTVRALVIGIDRRTVTDPFLKGDESMRYKRSIRLMKDYASAIASGGNRWNTNCSARDFFDHNQVLAWFALPHIPPWRKNRSRLQGHFREAGLPPWPIWIEGARHGQELYDEQELYGWFLPPSSRLGASADLGLRELAPLPQGYDRECLLEGIGGEAKLVAGEPAKVLTRKLSGSASLSQLSGLERSNADFCGAPAPKRESKQRRPVANHV